MFGVTTIRDDADKAVTGFDIRKAGESKDPALTELAQRIYLKRHFSGAILSKQSLLLLGVIAFIMIAGVTLVVVFQANSSIVGWLMPLAIFFGIAMTHRHTSGQLAGTVAEALVSYGRCGSCGYMIRDLPRDESGLTTCPECDAAWRAERFRFELDEAAPTALSLLDAECEAEAPPLVNRLTQSPSRRSRIRMADSFAPPIHAWWAPKRGWAKKRRRFEPGSTGDWWVERYC